MAPPGVAGSPRRGRMAPAEGAELELGGALSVGRALVLGALHGPAELLPISSSAHVALVPWLVGWDYHRLDGELRKCFEVALHVGTAAALVITLRNELSETLTGLSARRAALLALSCAPPAIAGYTLERTIERRFGTSPTIAAGLLAGSAAMAWADRAAQTRHHEDAGAHDALCLGIAQACALVPGVSRGGATLAAARLRRFSRPDANRLSRDAALPVIAGATLLKTVRLRRRGLPPGGGLPFAAGAGASFVSTLACTRLMAQVQRERSLMPYVAYRTALAAIVLRRLSQRSGAWRVPGGSWARGTRRRGPCTTTTP